MKTFLRDLSVNIETARRSNITTRWKRVGYSDEFSRIYYVESGEAFVRHHGNLYHLRPGHLFLIPAHTVMSYWCDSPFNFYWVHFTARLPGGLPLFDWLQCRYEIPMENPGQSLDNLKLIQNSYESTELGAELTANGMLRILLARFINTAATEQLTIGETSLLKFRTCLDYIDAQIHQPIRIDDLARVAGLERAYFSRAFTACLGIPPAAYIRERRIEKAKPLLTRTDMTIEEIADSLGFADAFHFSKMFKKQVGMPPSHYRRIPPQMP